MSSPKIAVYSLADLKNTTDDALPNYLSSLRFTPSHLLADVRLGLGYSAVAIAAATFALDYRLGWEQTKVVTLWAVVAYFVLNGALTAWVWGVEKGKIFTGGNERVLLSIASHVKKNTPVYNLTVRQADPSGAQNSWTTLEISAPFTRWFDADGHFVVKPFQQWLASAVAAVGEADPKNAQGAARELGNDGRGSAVEVGQVEATEVRVESWEKPGNSAAKETKSRRVRK